MRNIAFSTKLKKGRGNVEERRELRSIYVFIVTPLRDTCRTFQEAYFLI